MPTTAGARPAHAAAAGAPTPVLQDAVARTPVLVPSNPTTLSAASGPIRGAQSGADASSYRGLLVGLGVVAIALTVAIALVVSRRHTGKNTQPAAAVAASSADASQLTPMTDVRIDAYTPVAVDASTLPDASVSVDASSASARGTLVIETVPPGGKLEIDGTDIGTAPQRVERPVGTRVTIRAEKASYRPSVETRTVQSGEQKVRIKLAPRVPTVHQGSSAFDPNDVGGD